MMSEEERGSISNNNQPSMSVHYTVVDTRIRNKFGLLTMIDYKARIPFEWYKVSLYNIYKHKLPLLHVTIYIICC